MSAYLRKYATATTGGTNIGIPMIKAGVQDFATGSDWTPSAGDVKISIDAGTQANITTLPAYTNGQWVFGFTTGEVTGKSIRVAIVDSATKAVEDQFFTIETFGNASAMHLVDYTLASFGLSLAKTTNLTGLNDIAATAIVSAGAINTAAGLVSLAATQAYNNPGQTTSLPGDVKTVNGTTASPSGGTAQAGSTTSITLASADAQAAGALTGGWVVETTLGTGAGQYSLITAYNSSTKVATATFSVAPASGTGYRLHAPGFLAAQGLSLVDTTPAAHGSTPNFQQMIVATWRRWFRKHTGSGTTLTGYADDGTTVLTTQTIPTTSPDQTQGAA